MVVGQKGRSQGREIGERSRASGDGRDDHIDGHHDDDLAGHHQHQVHGRDDHIDGRQHDDDDHHQGNDYHIDGLHDDDEQFRDL